MRLTDKFMAELDTDLRERHPGYFIVQSYDGSYVALKHPQGAGHMRVSQRGLSNKEIVAWLDGWYKQEARLREKFHKLLSQDITADEVVAVLSTWVPL